MILIEIAGSVAATKLNGDGKAMVVIGRDHGKPSDLVYLRDIIEGWNDAAGNWKRIAESNAKYKETEKNLWSIGAVYLGAIVGSSFVAA